MLSTTGTLVLVLIFAAAGLLAAAPLVLGRRERRGRRGDPDEVDVAPSDEAMGEIVAVLGGEGRDRSLRSTPGATTVWLIVGVNGVGKTTTVAKLGAREVAAGSSVLLAAADTFRAAAADQLVHWADRLGVEVVR